MDASLAPGLRGGFHPAPELLAVEVVPDVEEAGPGLAGRLELAIEEPAGGLGKGGVRGRLGQRAGDLPAGDDRVLVLAEAILDPSRPPQEPAYALGGGLTQGR